MKAERLILATFPGNFLHETYPVPDFDGVASRSDGSEDLHCRLYGIGKGIPRFSFSELTCQSTLGEELAQILDLPFLCLDALSHRPQWEDTAVETFRSQTSEFIDAHSDGWIIDGNYQNKVADITWHSATDIIWLDYPIFVVLWRLWFRTIERIQSGVELWGIKGCVETWRSQFLSRHSLL